MPRLARLDVPEVLHHRMGRGIEKGKIFFDDQDRSGFLSRLAAQGEEKWMDRKKLGLRESAERVCGADGVRVNDLRAGSRRGEVVGVREDFSHAAVELLGYAGTEVG